MKWVPGPSLSKGRVFGSGFIDEQDGSFHYYGGEDEDGNQRNNFDRLPNDINAEFEQSSETFSFGGITQ